MLDVEDVTNPSSASVSLTSCTGCCPHALPQFMVTASLRPANLENPSEVGVEECFESLFGGNSNFAGLSSVGQVRLYNAVGDRALSIAAEIE